MTEKLDKLDGVTIVRVIKGEEWKKMEARCPLYKNHTCPYPKTCDGFQRKCTHWEKVSGR